jgi:hypothetical protein
VANLRQAVPPARNQGGKGCGRVKRGDGGHSALCYFNRFVRKPPWLTAWVGQDAAASPPGSSPCLQPRISNEICR